MQSWSDPQNRIQSPKQIHTQIWKVDMQHTVAFQISGKRMDYSLNGSGTLDHPYRKLSNQIPTSYHRGEIQFQVDSRSKREKAKLHNFQKKIGGYLYELGIRNKNDYLRHQTAQTIKELIDGFNYINFQNACTSRQHKQVKRQATDWEKICLIHLTDKGQNMRLYTSSCHHLTELSPTTLCNSLCPITLLLVIPRTFQAHPCSRAFALAIYLHFHLLRVFAQMLLSQ